MSHSQFHSIDLFILRHAWLNLWDKRMLLAESTRLLSLPYLRRQKPDRETKNKAPTSPCSTQTGTNARVSRKRCFSILEVFRKHWINFNEFDEIVPNAGALAHSRHSPNDLCSFMPSHNILSTESGDYSCDRCFTRGNIIQTRKFRWDMHWQRLSQLLLQSTSRSRILFAFLCAWSHASDGEQRLVKTDHSLLRQKRSARALCSCKWLL